ncbi:condensation domain-containing protein [Timonella sp. A28]|uniref:condensation domain-containing protein n=1 Tax=Timonella sp. A28 TaxID=3442640 RepID=UPI003EBA21E1
MTAQHVIWPTTPLQKGLLALTALDEEKGMSSSAYVGQTLLRIDGALDLDTLRNALTAVMSRLPNLRVRFVMGIDLEPVQVVNDDHETHLRVVHTSVKEAAETERITPFYLDEGQLVRWTAVVEKGQPTWLIITAHHAVLDGWSMPLLASLVAATYRGDIPYVPVYDTYLAWLAHESTDDAEEFWATRLQAYDFTGTAPWLTPTARSGTETLTTHVPAVQAADITPATVARALWGITLDRLAGSAPERGSQTFATTISGRTAHVPQVENMVGLCADSVLTVVDTEPAQTLAEAVQAHHRWWIDSLTHQHIGLRGIYRALGREELATSLFSFEHEQAATSWDVGDGTFTLTGVHDSSHFPLAISVTAGKTWQITLDYDTSTVEDHTAHTVLDTYVDLLNTYVRNPETSIADSAEHQWSAATVSNTDIAKTHLAPQLLAHAWHDAVKNYADRTALVVDDIRWTFTQVHDEIERACAHLQALDGHLEKHGGGSERIALQLPRNHHMVVNILAALVRGDAVIPLDPQLSDERLTTLLQASGATILINETGIHRIAAPVAQVVSERQSVASIVFTSGSTGTPKPVAVSHDALAHLLHRQAQELYPPRQPLRVAHTASFHFDAHWDAFLSILCGHELHVLSEEIYLDAYECAAYVGRERIDYVDFTPTVWSALLAGGELGYSTPLPRICVVGGEAFPPSLWTTLGDLAARSGSRVLNLYGPTETTVDALAAEVSRYDSPVVGTPLGSMTALVLDDLLRPVPVGTWGELYLAGPQVALGYVNQSAQTAHRFVARVDGSAGERMYRTGDLARIDPVHGAVVLGGRTDEQISLHGFRIEPGEIEQVIAQHPDVQEVVVFAQQHERLGKKLVAYVVASAENTEDELTHYCTRKLARHLVPSAFVCVSALPLTRNGKLDKRALPAPTWGGSRNVVEQDADIPHWDVVCASVAHVLKTVDAVLSPNDNFFALGGDSISAIRVSSVLRRQQLHIRAQQILHLKVLGDIARAVTGVSVSHDQVSSSPHLTATQHEKLSRHVREMCGSELAHVQWLTPTQQGIFVESAQAGSDRDPYKTTVTFALTSAAHITEDAIREALCAWLYRHPNLAIGVWQHDLPEPIAFVPEHRTIPVVVGHGDVPQAEAYELNRRQSFESAQLLGATWLPHSGHLVVSMHHIVSDGWSLPILAEELAEDLSLLVDGKPVQTDLKTPGFEAHLEYIAQLKTRRAELIQVWEKELEHYQPVLLAGERTTVHTYAGTARYSHEQLQVDGFTMAEAVQAAWAYTWAVAVGVDDVVIGVVSSGRTAEVEGAADAVGLFMTTKPVRVNVKEDNLRAQVRLSTERTEHAQHLGLGAATAVVGEELLDSLVVIENYPGLLSTGARVHVDVVAGHDNSGFAVCLTVFPTATPGEVRYEIESTTTAVHEPQLENLADLFERTLNYTAHSAQWNASTLAVRTKTAHTNSASRTTTQPHTSADKTTHETAETIAHTMAHILGTTSHGIHDDFFSHGGDSISAMTLIGALRKHSLVTTISVIFSARTPARIAEQTTHNTPTVSAAHIGALPLTPALAWFAEHTKNLPAENMRGFAQLRAISIPHTDGITAALSHLVERHPALRLRMHENHAEVLAHAPNTIVHEEHHHTTVEGLAQQLVDNLNHTQGVVLQAGTLTASPHHSEHILVIAIHHIAVDAVSWHIIIDELRALLNGETLPPLAASLHDWATALHEKAATLAPWPHDDDTTPSLTDKPLGTIQDSREVVVTLSKEHTQLFTAQLQQGIRADHLLAAASVHAADKPLIVELEGHGRNATHTIDSSTLVGWFTATWPIHVPRGTLPDIMHALQAAETRNTDYGLLRYLTHHTTPHPQSHILINYLGHETTHTNGPWEQVIDPAELESRLGIHNTLPVSHPIELNAYILDGHLTARFQIAQPIRDQAHLLTTQWEHALCAILTDTNTVEAVWPLTPVQRGIWFHSHTEDTDSYGSSVVLDLHGPLDATRLHNAVDAVVARHPQLRMTIATDNNGQPYALARHDTRAQWTHTHNPHSNRTHLLTEHEKHPFNLSETLLRAHLEQLTPEHHHLALASHHILLDGWSIPLLVEEIFAAYTHNEHPDTVEHNTDYAQAMRWFADRPTHTQQWEQTLHNATPTLLNLDGPATHSAAQPTHIRSAHTATTAWNLVLAALTNRTDVITGTVVSGRPAELEGSEQLLGMFINTLPARTTFTDTTTTEQLLTRDDTALRLESSHVALADLHRIAQVPTLFDTLVVVENYPHDPAHQPGAQAGIRIADIDGHDTTHYPLSLTVELAGTQAGELRLDYSHALNAEDARTLLHAVEHAAHRLHDDERVAVIVAELTELLAPTAHAVRPVIDASTHHEPPSAELTRDVAVIQQAYASTLGMPDVSADDDFFALGGDSISAIKVVSELRKNGLVVHAKTLFTAPTPQQLAQHAKPVQHHVTTFPTAQVSLLNDDSLAVIEDLMRSHQ